MKKLLSIIFVITILITPLASVRASEEIGFLEGLSNTYELESYQTLQNIYGDMQIEDFGDIVDINFRLSFSGNVNSKKAFENNQYMRVNGFLQINIIETENSISEEERYYPQPFDQMTANFNAEIVSIFNDGIYLRLSEVNVTAQGVGDEELDDMNAFLEEISPYKYNWYKIPMSALTANAQDGLTYEFGEDFNTELFEPETIIKYFQENDIKTAIGNYIKDIFLLIKDETGMTDEKYNQAVEMIDLAVDTKFFNLKDIVSGRNIGFKFFTFNKNSIINLIQGIGEIIGETLTYDDIKEIRTMMSKFNLAGIYRINNEYKVVDNFLIKLTLRNIESLIESNIKYRYKIRNFNDAPAVNAPTDYNEIEDLATLLSY